MPNEIYNFLKENNLTNKNENDFIKEYSDPEKAQELHGFLVENNLTKKDSAQFYDTYFKPSTTIVNSYTPLRDVGNMPDFSGIVKKSITPPAPQVSEIPRVDNPKPLPQRKKTETVYKSNSYSVEKPIPITEDELINSMSDEQLLTADNTTLKLALNTQKTPDEIDFNKQTIKNNQGQGYQEEAKLYGKRLKAVQDRAFVLESNLQAKYGKDFVAQTSKKYSDLESQGLQLKAYETKRVSEAEKLKKEATDIQEQANNGELDQIQAEVAYKAKIAQIKAIDDDLQKRYEPISKAQEEINATLQDEDFAKFMAMKGKESELYNESQSLITRPEYKDYRDAIDIGEKQQAIRDAQKKAYQSKGFLGKVSDVLGAVSQLSPVVIAENLISGKEDKTYTGTKIKDEGEKLLARTTRALTSLPQMASNLQPFGARSKYDFFDKVFDIASTYKTKTDIENPTASDVQRDIQEDYKVVDGYKVYLDGDKVKSVRDMGGYFVSPETSKTIQEKYKENPSLYKIQSDWDASTAVTKAVPTILDMGAMIATTALSGGGSVAMVASASAQMYGDFYDSAIQAGMKPQDANDFATLTSIATGMVTLVNPMESNIAKGVASKGIGRVFGTALTRADVLLLTEGKITLKELAKRVGKESLKNIGGENLEELVLEPFVQKATETIYNSKTQGDGFNTNWKFLSTKEDAETAIITTMASIFMTPIEVSSSMPEQRKIALQRSLDMPDKFVEMRKQMLDNGTITQEKFDYDVKAFEDIQKQYSAIKPEIKEDLHDDLAELLLKKYTLKDTIAKVGDDVLNKKNKLLLDDVDARLEQLIDGTYNKTQEQIIAMQREKPLIAGDEVRSYNSENVRIVDDMGDGVVLIDTGKVDENGVSVYDHVPKQDLKDKNIGEAVADNATIQSAVIEINGKIYEGKNHAEAILKAKADGQDISQVDRQAQGKFKLSDGTIIDRTEAKTRFGQDRSEMIIPQDEASNQANKDYAKITKNDNTATPTIEQGQGQDNSTAVSATPENGSGVQQGIGQNVSNEAEVAATEIQKEIDDKKAIISELENNPKSPFHKLVDIDAVKKEVADLESKQGDTLTNEVVEKGKTPNATVTPETKPSARDFLKQKIKEPEVVAEPSKVVNTPLVEENDGNSVVGLSFTTHNKETVTGQKLTDAINKVADDMVKSANKKRTEYYADHITEAQKDEFLAKELAYAEEVRQGKYLNNLGMAQRINYELTGESVPILPKEQPKSETPLVEEVVSKTETTAAAPGKKVSAEEITTEEINLAQEINLTKDETKSAKSTTAKRTRKSKSVIEIIENETEVVINNRDAKRAEELIESIEIAENVILNNIDADESFEKKYGVSELELAKVYNANGRKAKIGEAFEEITGKELVGSGYYATDEQQQQYDEFINDFIIAISNEGVKLVNPIDIDKNGLLIDSKPQPLKPIKTSGIESLSKIVSSDDLRPALSSVFIQGDNYIATDAHKIVIIKRNESDDSVIAKMKESLLKRYKKVAGDKEAKIAVEKEILKLKDGIDGKLLNLKNGEIVDAKYPDYKAVIPENIKKTKPINIQTIIDIANGAKNVLRNINGSKNGLSIPFVGYENINIGVNPTFLLDVLQTLQANGAKNVTLNIDKPNRAIIIKSDNGDLGLVMPIFLGGGTGLELSEGSTIIKSPEFEISISKNDATIMRDNLKKKLDNKSTYHVKEYNKAVKEKDDFGIRYHNPLMKEEVTELKESIQKLEDIINGDANLQSTAEQFTPIPKSKFNELLDKLKKAFPNVKVELFGKNDFDNAKKKLQDSGIKVTDTKTKEGTIYGFKTPDGKVFLNADEINANTPIHEFGHIWQSVFPQGFARGIELLKLSPQGQALINATRKNPAYAGKLLAEIQAEALVTAIGNKGEGIFNSNPTMYKRFTDWLTDFFKKIGDKLGIKELSADDKFDMFTKKVVGELLGGKTLDSKVGTETTDSKIDFQITLTKEAIGEAYDKAQQYLETTDFEFTPEQRDAFIADIKGNNLFKKIFTTTQLERIYEGEPLTAIDRLRIKYKILINDIKVNNKLSNEEFTQQQQLIADAVKGIIKGNLKGITGQQSEKLINTINKSITENSIAKLLKVINQVANLAEQRTLKKAQDLYETIRSRSNRKGATSAVLLALMKDFASINPEYVSDINQYIEIATRVKEATNSIKKPTDAEKRVAYNEVQKFIIDEAEQIRTNSIDKIIEEGDENTFVNVLDNKARKRFGKDFNDLENDQQQDVLDKLTVNDIKDNTSDEEKQMIEAFKDVKNENKKQEFITAVYGKIGQLKTAIEQSKGVLNQTPAQKRITDALLNMKIDNMPVLQMARTLKLVNNILENNDYSGGEALIAVKQADNLLAETKKISAKIKGFRKLWEWTSKIPNLVSITEAMSKGATLGAELQRALGLSEITRTMGVAQKYTHDVGERFKAMKFGTSIFEPLNQAKLAIYGALTQTPIGEDIDEVSHVKRWKSVVTENIKALRNTTSDTDKKEADILEQAYNEVIGDSQTMAEIERDFDVKLKAVHNFFVNEGIAQKPRFRENAELMHNETIEEYNNWTKLGIVSIYTGSAIEKSGEEILKKARSRGINKSKSQSIIDREEYQKLREGLKMDLNWINTQFNALNKNEYDIQTSSAITTVATMFRDNNKELRDLLGENNFRILQDKLKRMMNTEYSEGSIVETVIEQLTKRGRVMALGNILPTGMVFSSMKQLSVLMSTVINNTSTSEAPIDLTWLTGTESQKENVAKLFSQSDIGARRASGAGGYFDNTKITDKISDGIIVKGAKTTGKGLDYGGELSMKALRNSDIIGADISWITYYKKYLRNNGLTFDSENEYKNPNKDAMAYAETWVQRNQGANTEQGQAEIWKSLAGWAKIMLPFMGFGTQANVRAMNNWRNLVNGEAKGEALRDITAQSTEIALFNGVKYGMSYAIVTQALPFLKELIMGGDDDDEVEKLRKRQTVKDGYWQQQAQDHYGLFPLFDNATKIAINRIYKEASGTDVPLLPTYDNTKDFSYLGTPGVAIQKGADIWEDWNIIRNKPIFGGLSGMESKATVYEYKGKRFVLVHSNGYIGTKGFMSDKATKNVWKNTDEDAYGAIKYGRVNNYEEEGKIKYSEPITEDVLKAFITNPSDFKFVKNLAVTEKSGTGQKPLDLTKKEQDFMKFKLVVDAVTFIASDAQLNRILSSMKNELKKQTKNERVVPQ